MVTLPRVIIQTKIMASWSAEAIYMKYETLQGQHTCDTIHTWF